jgi:hypothetical protein
MTQNTAPRPLGETYVLKGKVPGDYSQHRIILFDGRFDTAWRVVQFIVAPEKIIDGSADLSAKLMTEKSEASQPAGEWLWEDTREIGWASWYNAGTRASTPYNAIIDPENLIIEDLYITSTISSDAPDNLVNYMIVLEKYKITQGQGTITYIKNRGQDV